MCHDSPAAQQRFLEENPDLLAREKLLLGIRETIQQQLESQGMTLDQLALVAKIPPATLRNAMDHMVLTPQALGRIAAALRCNWKIELVPRP